MVFYLQGKKFLGVYCETNDSKVVKLSSTEPGDKRTYKCACKDTESSGASSMHCAIHYWYNVVSSLNTRRKEFFFSWCTL